MILTIHIPTGAHLKIKSGDSVDFDTPLYETASTAEYSLAFAHNLGVSPSKIFHYLKKFVGDNVQKGDVIAVKKGFLSTKKITSEYEGKIKEIDHNEGKIVILTKDSKLTVNSPIKGEVTEIKNNKITIKIKEGKEFAVKASSGDFGGKTVYFKNPFMSFSSSDVTGKIVVSESLASYIQSKLEALGITGYISLMKLNEKTDLPFAQLKTVQELSDIMDHIYPYCFVDTKLGKIIFYK